MESTDPTLTAGVRMTRAQMKRLQGSEAESSDSRPGTPSTLPSTTSEAVPLRMTRRHSTSTPVMGAGTPSKVRPHLRSETPELNSPRRSTRRRSSSITEDDMLSMSTKVAKTPPFDPLEEEGQDHDDQADKKVKPRGRPRSSRSQSTTPPGRDQQLSPNKTTPKQLGRGNRRRKTSYFVDKIEEQDGEEKERSGSEREDHMSAGDSKHDSKTDDSDVKTNGQSIDRSDDKADDQEHMAMAKDGNEQAESGNVDNVQLKSMVRTSLSLNQVDSTKSVIFDVPENADNSLKKTLPKTPAVNKMKKLLDKQQVSSSEGSFIGHSGQNISNDASMDISMENMDEASKESNHSKNKSATDSIYFDYAGTPCKMRNMKIVLSSTPMLLKQSSPAGPEAHDKEKSNQQKTAQTKKTDESDLRSPSVSTSNIVDKKTPHKEEQNAESINEQNGNVSLVAEKSKSPSKLVEASELHEPNKSIKEQAEANDKVGATPKNNRSLNKSDSQEEETSAPNPRKRSSGKLNKSENMSSFQRGGEEQEDSQEEVTSAANPRKRSSGKLNKSENMSSFQRGGEEQEVNRSFNKSDSQEEVTSAANPPNRSSEKLNKSENISSFQKSGEEEEVNRSFNKSDSQEEVTSAANPRKRSSGKLNKSENMSSFQKGGEEQARYNFSNSWTQNVRVRVSDNTKIDMISTYKQSDSGKAKKEESRKSKDQSAQFDESNDSDLMEFNSDLNDEEDQQEAEEEEDRNKNELVEDEAMEASMNYESGDSMSETERQEMLENEIPEHGESLGSDDTSEEEDNSGFENDSFIVSDSADTSNPLSLDGKVNVLKYDEAEEREICRRIIAHIDSTASHDELSGQEDDSDSCKEITKNTSGTNSRTSKSCLGPLPKGSASKQKDRRAASKSPQQSLTKGGQELPATGNDSMNSSNSSSRVPIKLKNVAILTSSDDDEDEDEHKHDKEKQPKRSSVLSQSLHWGRDPDEFDSSEEEVVEFKNVSSKNKSLNASPKSENLETSNGHIQELRVEECEIVKDKEKDKYKAAASPSKALMTLMSEEEEAEAEVNISAPWRRKKKGLSVSFDESALLKKESKNATGKVLHHSFTLDTGIREQGVQELIEHSQKAVLATVKETTEDKVELDASQAEAQPQVVEHNKESSIAHVAAEPNKSICEQLDQLSKVEKATVGSMQRHSLGSEGPLSVGKKRKRRSLNVTYEEESASPSTSFLESIPSHKLEVEQRRAKRLYLSPVDGEQQSKISAAAMPQHRASCAGDALKTSPKASALSDSSPSNDNNNNKGGRLNEAALKKKQKKENKRVLNKVADEDRKLDEEQTILKPVEQAEKPRQVSHNSCAEGSQKMKKFAAKEKANNSREEALKRAVETSVGILLKPIKSGIDKDMKIESKRLPEEFLKELDEKPVRQKKKDKDGQQKHTILSSAGIVVEVPPSPLSKRKKVHELHLPTGVVRVEPASPTTVGFHVSPGTPVAHSTGFKVRRLLEHGQDKTPTLQKKSGKRKRTVREPVYAYPSSTTTASGQFKEEPVMIRSVGKAGATEFYVSSLKKLSRSTPALADVQNFKMNAIFNKNIPRESNKNIHSRQVRTELNRRY